MDKLLQQYGLPGAVIIALAGYVMYLHKMYGKRLKNQDDGHSNERKEWLHTTNKFIEVVSSVKTLVESVSSRI